MTAGHATTPLADELGLKPGMRAFVVDMPDPVRRTIALDGLGLTLLAAPSTGIDAAHIFVTDRQALAQELNALRQLIAPGGFIWVAWPASGSDIDADLVREMAAPAGLADVQRCAIDPDWSALKLMTRKASR